MSSVLRDDAARARIVRELARNLVVEAGAGSGKTHAMAARMAAGLASGVYALERMAAVTFTRKAAAELRGRFQQALEERLAGEKDPGVRERVLAALSNLERFFAGTIHAFCARLLRERPVEAGVSPGFTELDEVEEELLRMESWRDFRSQLTAAGDPDLLLLAESGIDPQDLDASFKEMCTYEDVEFPAVDVPPPDPAPAWAELDTFWREIERRLPRVIAPDSTCDMQDRAVTFAREWRFASVRQRTPARLAALLGLWDAQLKCVQKHWSDDRSVAKRLTEEVKALHSAFRESIVKPYLIAWRRHLYAPCVRVLTRARAYAAEERRRRSTLSFNDLLIYTARLLREKPAVRRALQKKYRHIFVDEFQDTDPIQAEILLLLTSPAGGDAGKPRPGRSKSAPASTPSLCVVGDPKQSIYRFRRADISIYNEVRATLAGDDGAGVVSLTTNFRSVPALCEWANRVFAAEFPAQPDEWQPAFAPLDAERKPGRDQAVWTLTIPSDSESIAEEDAARIARYIKHEVAAGRRRYGDFLILTRMKRRLLPYARALETLEIPIEVGGAGGFSDSTEVGALAELLVALADPQDAVSLVGVLRGPFFGLSDRQLFAYRQSGGFLGIFGDAAVTDEAAQPVATALETLRRWYRWTRLLPAGAALDRILDDSGYLALAATTPGGVEAGDLLHAVDRVRAAVEAGMTLAAAATALVTEDLEASDIESIPLEPGQRDVVRLMNLHKAKGLEAAVVFLADPNGGFDPKVDVRVIRPAGAAGGSTAAVGYLPIVQRRKGSFLRRVLAAPPDWDDHEAAEQQFLRAESRRLLYVAATRARDMLVVSRAPKKGKSTPAWSDFDPYLAGAPELPVPEAPASAVRETVDLSADATRAAADGAIERHVRARRASWTATSVTAEAKGLPGRPLDESVPANPDDPTAVITADSPGRRADAGLAWGTLVHGLLEHAMRHPAATRDDLRRLAMWLTVEHVHLRDVVEQALDTVEAVARADFWSEARAASERHEEVPFAVREDADGLPRVVSGAIDLVYGGHAASPANAQWQIVDYKTDRDAGSADLTRRYRAQVEAYAAAWEKVAGGRAATKIVSARTGVDEGEG